jgi:hypothetical protein
MEMSKKQRAGYRSILIAESAFVALQNIQKDRSEGGVRFDLSLLATAAIQAALEPANAAQEIKRRAAFDLVQSFKGSSHV